MRTAVVFLASIFFVSLNVCAQAVDLCADPEASAFDQQIGEWVSADGKKIHEISRTLEGCGVQEVWKTNGKETARALKSFDGGSHDKNGEKRWYYTWTGRGYHQLWQGRKQNGRWLFYREWWLQGKPMLSRTYWNFLPEGKLERVVEQSLDAGMTWRPHVSETFTKRR
ncbi:MAG TPA: hypothetical protein VJL58_00705 [Pyrinomonadaceae bacterium]|nr:hypothetical protein [Pyrinomonadaceae bacterium]